MLKLIRYIHQNPVRAGMASNVENYKWSSDIYYRKDIRSFITRFTERFFALFAKKLPERFNEAGDICPPPIARIGTSHL